MTPTEVETTRPCELCGSSSAWRLSDAGRGGARFRTVVCRRCGLVFSDPFPHDVRGFYERRYRLDYKGAPVPKPKHVLRAGLVALDRRRRLADLFAPGARLLDIGSGGGEFLYLMTRLGLDARGVEPNLGWAEYSRSALGLDVSVGFVQDLSLPPASLDVVTVWHVLEHLENPSGVLAGLGALLSPEGSLVVEVPNVKALSQSPSSTFHVAHLYNFSAGTLSAMVAKAGLVPRLSGLSFDGGNLTVVAGRPPDDASGAPPAGRPDPAASPGAGLPAAAADPAASRFEAALAGLGGEAGEVLGLIASRSAVGHLFSGWPLRRAWGRLVRAASELRAVSSVPDDLPSRKAILDRLYREAIDASPAAPGP